MFLELLVATQVTTADLERFRTILPMDEGIVERAKQRWTELGVSRAEIEETMFPVVIRSFGERCVHFFGRANLIAGEPTFCYELTTETLTREDYKVEP